MLPSSVNGLPDLSMVDIDPRPLPRLLRMHWPLASPLLQCPSLNPKLNLEWIRVPDRMPDSATFRRPRVSPVESFQLTQFGRS